MGGVRPNARPLIGVTGPSVGGEVMYRFIRGALGLAGARTVRVTPRHWVHLEALHGVVLGGGADIDPARYGQPNRLPSREQVPKVDPLVDDGDRASLAPVRTSWWRTASGGASTARAMETMATDSVLGAVALAQAADEAVFDEARPSLVDRPSAPSRISMPDLGLSREARAELGIGSAPVDRLRDALEFDMLAGALARGLPVLGICRGLQLINVHFGGTLHQDVLQLVPPSKHRFTLLPRVKLSIVHGSRLGALLGPGIHRVNRLHRQAVDRLGAGVRVAARDVSGLVQAIEVEGPPFCYGVQWHPEYLPYVRTQRRLFEALVAAARQTIVPSARW